MSRAFSKPLRAQTLLQQRPGLLRCPSDISPIDTPCRVVAMDVVPVAPLVAVDRVDRLRLQRLVQRGEERFGRGLDGRRGHARLLDGIEAGDERAIGRHPLEGLGERLGVTLAVGPLRRVRALLFHAVREERHDRDHEQCPNRCQHRRPFQFASSRPPEGCSIRTWRPVENPSLPITRCRRSPER